MRTIGLPRSTQKMIRGEVFPEFFRDLSVFRVAILTNFFSFCSIQEVDDIYLLSLIRTEIRESERCS